MTAYHDIAPSTQILDANGYDWSWAFVYFREVPGFPAYRAGSNGTIWSCWFKWGRKCWMSERWTLMRPRPLSGTKYLTIGLRHRGLKRDFTVHRVILESFIGPRLPGMVACHRDSNPRNNAISNLRWGTYASNMKDMRDAGNALVGSRNVMAKIDEAAASAIRSGYANGCPQDVLAKRYGIAQSSVSKIVAGLRWKHVPLGG